MNWYFAENDQRVGPVSSFELAEAINSGRVGNETLLWAEGMADWQTFAKIRSQPELFEAENMAVCAESGKLLSRDEMMEFEGSYIGSNYKDAFFQKMQEGVPRQEQVALAFTYAGFWIRFLAKFIDGIIFMIAFYAVFFAVLFGIGVLSGGDIMDPNNEDGMAILGVVMMVGVYGIGAIMGVLYNVFFLTKFGATPGKLAVGIKVVNTDGTYVSAAKATGRFFGDVLSGITFYIGYIIAAFDEEKRALHDHICSTRVIYKDR